MILQPPTMAWFGYSQSSSKDNNPTGGCSEWSNGPRSQVKALNNLECVFCVVVLLQKMAAEQITVNLDDMWSAFVCWREPVSGISDSPVFLSDCGYGLVETAALDSFGSAADYSQRVWSAFTLRRIIQQFLSDFG